MDHMTMGLGGWRNIFLLLRMGLLLLAMVTVSLFVDGKTVT